jgi:hypothetical protein
LTPDSRRSVSVILKRDFASSAKEGTPSFPMPGAERQGSDGCSFEETMMVAWVFYIRTRAAG